MAKPKPKPRLKPKPKLNNMPRRDLPFCGCGTLERAAHDPDCPIEFDEQLKEFHIIHGVGGRAKMSIYHCPFCAGRAPESLRPKLFATVEYEEISRLHRLTNDLKTEEDVRAVLGEPTTILDPGVMRETPEKDGKPPVFTACKTLHYNNHSDTADIRVNVRRDGKVSISWSGKYIGPRKDGTAPG